MRERVQVQMPDEDPNTLSLRQMELLHRKHIGESDGDRVHGIAKRLFAFQISSFGLQFTWLIIHTNSVNHLDIQTSPYTPGHPQACV